MPTFKEHIVSSPQRLAREICADIMATEDEIAEAIEAAVQHEREACARLADEFRELPHGSVPTNGLEATWNAAKQISDAIRNR